MPEVQGEKGLAARYSRANEVKRIVNRTARQVLAGGHIEGFLVFRRAKGDQLEVRQHGVLDKTAGVGGQ